MDKYEIKKIREMDERVGGDGMRGGGGDGMKGWGDRMRGWKVMG